jgi:hypothetical protein
MPLLQLSFRRLPVFVMSTQPLRYRVYRSPIAGRNDWLVLPENSDFPHAVIDDFANAEWWKTIELDPATRYVGLDVREALADIDAKGFHIMRARIETIEEWPGDVP